MYFPGLSLSGAQIGIFRENSVNTMAAEALATGYHDVVIKWKHFPRYWTFVRGIYWFPVIFSEERFQPAASTECREIFETEK